MRPVEWARIREPLERIRSRLRQVRVLTQCLLPLVSCPFDQAPSFPDCTLPDLPCFLPRWCSSLLCASSQCPLGRLDGALELVRLDHPFPSSSELICVELIGRCGERWHQDGEIYVHGGSIAANNRTLRITQFLSGVCAHAIVEPYVGGVLR